MRSLLKFAAVFSTINILFTILGLYAYDRYFTREIVVFDVPAYVNELRTDFVKGKIAEDELKEKLGSLKSRLEEISKKKVILIQDAVIAGGRDILDDIESIGEE